MRLAPLALALVPALLAAGSARAVTNEDLSGLSNREYIQYARDRFEWLTGEGRSSHHLARKYHRECEDAAKAGGSGSGSGSGDQACEIAKTADERGEEVLRETGTLVQGLQQRLGHVPEWAREAAAGIAESVGRSPASSKAEASAPVRPLAGTPDVP